MASPVRFVFDFISPYAYVGWTQIHALCTRCERTVEPWPVLFAALLDAHGNVGPAEVPAKRVYAFKDSARKAHAAGAPALVPPPSHPFNPLLALRVVSLPLDDVARHRLISALFAATWAGGGGIDAPAKVARVASAVGLDGEALVIAAGTDVAKAALRTQTDDAIARGVFGVPTAIVDDEMFWGVDSLPHLEMYLQGRDPIDAAALDRWRALPATAQRKR